MAYRPFIIPTVANVASVAAAHPKKDEAVSKGEAAKVVAFPRKPDALAGGLSPETHARLAAVLSQPTPPNIAAHVAARMTMSADRKQATDWWKEPVEGWPEKIVITPMVTGKAITIKLRGKPKPWQE